jgi:hypothetical protein
MERLPTLDQITEGRTVYGADGAKLGTIALVDPTSCVVEKGFFFPTDYAIPLSAIARIDDDGAWLHVTKDAALQQGRAVAPRAEPDAALAAPMAPAATTWREDPGAWTPASNADYDGLVGMDVASADDHKVGTIRVVQHPAVEQPGVAGQHVFLLEPGLVNDWFVGFEAVYLPETAIAAVEPDRVVLHLTAEQIQQRRQAWTQPPAGFDDARSHEVDTPVVEAEAPVVDAEPAIRTWPGTP